MGGDVGSNIRLVVALAAITTASVATAQSEPVVRTTYGPVRGASEAGVIAFKGVPFAAPPVGPLRWRAPQPLTPWAMVRDATAYASDCMQLPFPSDAAPLGTAPSEDCLYANVWRPATAAKKLPVMVWIYGGGFVNGGSSPPTYSGAALARAGIMVMSFNYRLGRFGSFVHPALRPADANYGLLDQLAALRWVKANIARFGGDPDNVTIIGESAGGMSVHALLTSPAATGLFKRAVIESGGTASANGASLATAEAAGITFARSKRVATDDPQAAAKLRALPAEQVVDGLNLAAMNQPGYSGPVPDGRTFVDSLATYRAGRFAHVPVMIGATSDDIGGPNGSMIAGARDLARLLAQQNVPVYYYRFDYVATSAQTPQTKGAAHAADIPFFFDTAAIKYGQATSDADRSAARILSGYLVNFVKTGDPNGGASPSWRRYTAAGRAMLTLIRTGDASVASE